MLERFRETVAATMRRREFRRDGATGLGLHIVHSMVVDQLEGRLSLTRETGRGTTVRLILPRSIPREARADPS